MSEVLRVENVSKRYRLGDINRQLLYEEMRSRWARWRGTEDPNLKVTDAPPSANELWALRDVSFSLEEGDVLAVIGRNGSGKSTLLKIISRLTAPTSGRVLLKGRVASLLEVGTGFHPELTGRENVYLNGVILGMSRQEVTRKYDEIVAFSEVERFMETPVKRYSSGMRVRLAFAVAAHLEAELLILDEVLAVGDRAFQQKCLAKITSVARDGRTVLFVNHQMASVQELCSRCLLLQNGRLELEGAPEEVITRYLGVHGTASADIPIDAARQGTGRLRFLSVTSGEVDGGGTAKIVCGASARLVLRLENRTAGELRNVRLAFNLDNESGHRVTAFDSDVSSGTIPPLPPGISTVEITVPRVSLAPGMYHVTLFAAIDEEIADWVRNAATLDVAHGDFFGTGLLPRGVHSPALLDHHFTVRAERAAVGKADFLRQG